jgi:mannose-1-phosphate guanylyltransferase
MSRHHQPKQLVPFLDGRSLLHMAWERLDGLIDADRIGVCAAEAYRDAILCALPDLRTEMYIGEPTGRDTLNAAGLSAAVLARMDPGATVALVTSDHIIGPVDAFRAYLDQGYGIVEQDPGTMVTFGITPTAPATGFGYLALDKPIGNGVFSVSEFCEKPELPIAEKYFEAGPERYLWNSGMFVWNVATLLDCIRRYEPEVYDGLSRIADAWDTPAHSEVIEAEYPRLRKISVDFAVMERAARDPSLKVVAVPMRLEWMDVGNWASFARTCPEDEDGNRLHAPRAVLLDCRSTLVASTDPDHLIAAVGCDGLIVVHTPDATLICPADRVEDVKALTGRIMECIGPEAL